jgi:hypothetical protein
MKLCRYIIGVLACALSLLAQSDRGTLTGTVQDPGSAMIPGATVIAKNSETGSVFQTVSTSTGNFTITALPAGVYDLTVEAPGFRRYIGKGTQVQVAQTVRLDVILEVGAVTESVTVQAEAVLLKTDSAEQSVNVTGDKINNLPLNFGGGGGNIGGIRTPLTFMVLSPGVSGVAGTGGTGTAARVNGLPGNSFRVFVDGQDTTNNNDTASTAGQPSVEMIEEFSLQTSNFSAEFGQVAGGMFTFATRSGTNQLHGSLYEYFNNEALDAGKPYVHQRPQSRKHDFGGSLSGPIWIPKIYDGRNRTFFFLNYEAFRNDISAAGARNTVPTAAYRNGDFSGALTGRVLGTDPLGRPILENAIYDPATTRTINGQVVRDPFPNNIIPTSRFDPVAARIQSLFPQPDFAGNINNWIQNPISNKVSATPAMKLDHSFTQASKLSFYTTKSWNHTMQNGLDALPIPLTAFRDQRTYSYTTRVNYDHSLSPTLLLHVGAGFLRFLNPDSSPNSVLEYDAEGQLGFRGAATGGGGVGGGFPRITGLSNSQGGMINVGPTNANYYWVGKLTVPVSLTYVRNNHTWKIGAEYRLESYTDRNTRGASGVLAFSSEQTALPYLQSTNLGGGNIGFPYASFLLGLANTASVNAPQDPQWRNDRWGLYLQDTWKVTRKLTLDLGIRWDLMDQGHEIHYRNSMFGPTIPNPTAGGLPGGMVYEGFGPGRCDCNFIGKYPYAIGPRLGFAYQITPKTVIRGGWGVVYGNTPTYQYFTNSAILGVGFDQMQWAAPGFADPALVLSNGMQYNRADLNRVSLDPGLRPARGQLNAPNYYLDPNAGRPPRINQWSLNLQREVFRGLTVEAAYVANRAIWLNQGNLGSLNQISDAKLASVGLDRTNAADRTLLSSRIDSALAAQRGFRAPYAGFPGSATVAQTLRPFPQFSSSINPMWAPLGNSWYDSLQVKVTKRYSHGLDMQMAFTWQKELATGQGINDVFNRPNQKSIAANSQPLVLVTAFNYEVPRFTESKIVRAVASGWTIGGLLRYSSGIPIAVPTATSNLSNFILQDTRMNRVPGEPLYIKDLNCGCIDPNQDFVLNPKAWVNPAPGEWGVSPVFYSDFRHQRRPSEQFSFGRVFRVKERASFSIRAEFFNAFNRIILPQPSTANPLQTQTRNPQTGVPTAGYGRIDATAVGGQRNGQIVARLQW